MPEPLLPIIAASFSSSAARSGPHLVCKPGCSQCCHGVFQISPLDAHRLREGLNLAELEDPTRATRIRARIAAARTLLTPFFPGDPVTGILSPNEADEGQIDLFEEGFSTEPCPILDPGTQTCDLYAHRPVLCRTFGPPIRNDHTDPDAGLAICELCFTTATETEILAAEMSSSFRPLEHSLEADFLATHPEAGPTLIPFAFPLP